MLTSSYLMGKAPPWLKRNVFYVPIQFSLMDGGWLKNWLLWVLSCLLFNEIEDGEKGTQLPSHLLLNPSCLLQNLMRTSPISCLIIIGWNVKRCRTRSWILNLRFQFLHLQLHDISRITASTYLSFLYQGLPGSDGPVGDKGETVCINNIFYLLINIEPKK